ncbi:hypothetical protein ACFOY2_08820 [Nonomuraea purpurea]|uniref:DUF3558 domain-containing protein n=1 Tax=Nonomuraea purpurea TaxID=1849276 RepID=A0ABV8FZZ3_9ACTN
MIAVTAVVLSGCGVVANIQPRNSEPPQESAASSSQEPSAQESSPQESSPPDEEGDLTAHFKRVRAADPCELVTHPTLKKYGPEQLVVRGRGMTDCQELTGYSDPAKSVYSFKIGLHSSFGERDAKDAKKEQLGGRTIYIEEYSTDKESHRSCHIKVPYEGVTGSAFSLDVRQTPPRGQEAKPWPQRCEAAKEYLAEVMDTLLELPPRKKGAVGVLGKDPCARQKEMVGALGRAYRLTERRYIGPYGCELVLANSGQNQELTVSAGFAFHVRQRATGQTARFKSRRLSLDGLYTVQNTKDLHMTRSCGNSVEVRRAANSAKNDAHYLSVSLSSAKLQVQDEDDEIKAPQVSCALTDKLTRIALDDVR